MTVLSDPDTPAFAPPASRVQGGERGSGRSGALVRSVRTSAPVFPFLAYVILVLGVPTAIIGFTRFAPTPGHFTFSNITRSWPRKPRPTRRAVSTAQGSEQPQIGPGDGRSARRCSAPLSRTPSSTSEHAAFKRITSATAGVLAQFGGVNLAFMFIASFALTNGIVTQWLQGHRSRPVELTDGASTSSGAWRSSTCTSRFPSWSSSSPPPSPVSKPPGARRRRTSARRGGASGARRRARAGARHARQHVSALRERLLGLRHRGGADRRHHRHHADSDRRNLARQRHRDRANIGYALGFAMIVILLVSVIFYVLLRRQDVAMASLELGAPRSPTTSWRSRAPCQRRHPG